MPIRIPLDDLPAGALYDDACAAGRIEGKAVVIEDVELRRLWGKHGLFGLAHLPPDLLSPPGCCGK